MMNDQGSAACAAESLKFEVAKKRNGQMNACPAGQAVRNAESDGARLKP